MRREQPSSYQIFGQHLAINWEDGHESFLSFQLLRDRCPCAACQGEPDLLGRVPSKIEVRETPAKSYELIRIYPVGHYAIQLEWADGHSTGIFAFDYLRGLCDCDLCQ
ncbi:MAG: DUF971 domain-containing protein [Fidelibacterota bacterium]|nr:MAG: DUF971 domain-containing protein [Candidatus Neomarinimicrobiota bacterium]